MSWGVTGVFWAFSLIPSPMTLQYFAKATSYLLMIETFFIFSTAITVFISFFTNSDQYDVAYQHSAPYSKVSYSMGQAWNWSEGRDIPVDFALADFEMQISAIGLQFVAYPILQLGANEGVAQVNAVNKKKASLRNPKPTGDGTEPEEEVEEEDQNWI
jgi:hypothetical protein